MAKGKRWDMKKKLVEMRKFERAVPKQVGNMMLNHFLQSFDDEAFSDTRKSSDPWKQRSSKTKADRRTGRRRGLLIQSGSLKGSLRVNSATMKKIAVGSYGIKYATFHNNGTKRLPKRQFIGESQVLNRKIRTLIKKKLKQII